ncbi:MAG: hypothetical protein ACP5UZ_03160 [Thermoplasmata archaeon]
MDVVLGLVTLFTAMVIAIYVRGAALRSGRRNSTLIYKDLRVITSEGSTPGIMMYLISILTVFIGPFSYKFYPMNNVIYVAMNIIAAIFFALLYPPFAPVTGFSTIDIIEREGVKSCIVGRVMNRKFNVVSISQKPNFEIVAQSRRHRLVFRVTNPLPPQK